MTDPRVRNHLGVSASSRRMLHYACSEGVPRRSFRVALIVGSVLNLINQGDALLNAAPVNWLKLLLTYVVPYAVSTYGVVSYRMNADRTNNSQGS